MEEKDADGLKLEGVGRVDGWLKGEDKGGLWCLLEWIVMRD